MRGTDVAAAGNEQESSGQAGLRIGIAPDSWGVWFPQGDDQPAPERYLREVPQAGYRWTELGPYGYLGTDAGRLRDQLDEAGLLLTAGTVFTSLQRGPDEIERNWRDVREVAELVSRLGGEHIITLPEMWQRDDAGDGPVMGRRTFDDEQWADFIAGHDEIGRRLLEEFGLRQQFHSHADSGVGTESEVVRLLEGTDPRYVNLCLDTGHYAYYLGDSVSLMRAHPDRIGYLHLKQVDPGLLADVLKRDMSFPQAVRLGIMCEPPDGIPAYEPILSEAFRIDPQMYAVVEQDLYPVQDFALPMQIASRTLEHIASCGAPVRLR